MLRLPFLSANPVVQALSSHNPTSAEWIDRETGYLTGAQARWQPAHCAIFCTARGHLHADVIVAHVAPMIVTKFC